MEISGEIINWVAEQSDPKGSINTSALLDEFATKGSVLYLPGAGDDGHEAAKEVFKHAYYDAQKNGWRNIVKQNLEHTVAGITRPRVAADILKAMQSQLPGNIFAKETVGQCDWATAA